MAETLTGWSMPHCAFVDRCEVGEFHLEPLQLAAAVDLFRRQVVGIWRNRGVHARIADEIGVGRHQGLQAGGRGHDGSGFDLRLDRRLDARDRSGRGADIDGRLERQHAAGGAGRHGGGEQDKRTAEEAAPRRRSGRACRARRGLQAGAAVIRHRAGSELDTQRAPRARHRRTYRDMLWRRPSLAPKSKGKLSAAIYRCGQIAARYSQTVPPWRRGARSKCRCSA